MTVRWAIVGAVIGAILGSIITAGTLLYTCPYRKSDPHVLMVKPTEDRPHLDTAVALNGPSIGRILA